MTRIEKDFSIYKVGGGGKLGKTFWFVAVFLLLISLVVPVAAQENVVVKDAAGGTVASGADFTIVKDSLNGNTAVVGADFTESAMVGFSGDTSFSIISEDGTLKKISAGAGMTAGNGAFFNLTSNHTLTLDLSNVQFSGGKGAADVDGYVTGGAIFSAGNLKLTGNAIFGGENATDGNTAGYGGALGDYGSGYTKSIELNGNFQFLNNSVDVAGGAINGGSVTFSGGTYTFTNNSAGNWGGAILARSVTFSGRGSIATFTGNTASGVNNDINVSGGGGVTIQDGGTYSFGGGIVAGSLIIGVDGQDGTPEVTFGSGSITKLSSFTLTGGSRLNVMLNQDNLEEVGDASKMTKFEGGGATGSADSVVWFFLDATENGTYTAMLGDNKKFESSFFAQMTQDGSGVAVVKKGLYEITIDVDTPTGIVHRYNSASEHQISDDLFNVAATGAATGDKIILTGDAISTAVTNLSGVTSLSIYSNVADIVRKITNTNATDGAFLVFDSDIALELGDVKFTGGKGENGVIHSGSKMTLTGNAIFEENTAINGGALAGGSFELKGDFQFLNNSTTFQPGPTSGGAIYADDTVTFSGGTNTFTNNLANGYGGAIYANDVKFFGGTNTFTENSVTHSTGGRASGGAIYADDTVTFFGGTNTFTNNSATYFGGAIYADDTVTFSGGTNTFTNNSTTHSGGEATHGGAIYAFNNVTFTGGTNTFTNNSTMYYGGAIYTHNGDVMFSGGTNTFTNNSVYGDGGAIWARNAVTFSGAGSVATFSGNKAGGVNNDIYSDLGDVTIQDGGTYYFGGGIVATKTTYGKLTIGAATQDGTPDVTFGSGSITNVNALELAGGNISVWLNSGNEVDAIGDIADTTTGATKFTSANAVTVSGDNSLKFYLDGILSVNDVYN
ncbi:MAG: hypothetical protein Q4D62_13340, partial [Planctomycetia bacterium]|nr:hypothetical protein [Planctomycetia bacterium]